MATAGAMSPDSQGDRITRLEERQAEHRDHIRALGPLIAQYAVLEEKFANLRDDVNRGFDGIRAEISEMKKDAKDRAKERRTMLIALFVAGVGLFGTFAAQLMQLRGGK